MKQGRVVQRGSFAELVRDPAEPFVEEFITAQKEPLNTLMEAFA
jgi:ABC-type proline/glycine betaine transport system ATPase subunit